MKCICCNKIVKAILVDVDVASQEGAVFEKGEPDFPRAENRMWLDGVVGNISAGYGSTIDGEQYVIAICDRCLLRKREEGVVAYIGNYMFHDSETKDNIDKYRKIWRRSNNLDELT